MVITSLGSVNLPEADSYMQDAAADGSGSGQGGRWQDEEDDEVRGSGSGNGPDRKCYIFENKLIQDKHKTRIIMKS